MREEIHDGNIGVCELNLSRKVTKLSIYLCVVRDTDWSKARGRGQQLVRHSAHMYWLAYVLSGTSQRSREQRILWLSIVVYKLRRHAKLFIIPSCF